MVLLVSTAIDKALARIPTDATPDRATPSVATEKRTRKESLHWMEYD